MKRPRRPPITDQFEFDRNIVPKGKSYQWIAIEVNGEKQDISRALAAGWKPVPFKRHAKIFADANSKGRIVIEGLMLVENSKSWVESQHTANQLDAQWSAEQRKIGFFGSAGGIDLPPSFQPMLPCGGFQGEWHAPHKTALDIDVVVTLRLAPPQLDAAQSLGLSPQEYGQRLVKMTAVNPLGIWPIYYGLPEFFPKKEEH